MTYEEIKFKLLLLGEKPTLEELDQAIQHQTAVVTRASVSYAKHTAKQLRAKAVHHRENDDQRANTKRDADQCEGRDDRDEALVFAWRELKVNEVVVRDDHSRPAPSA